MRTEVASADSPLILYDGECGLCSGGVRFFVKRDPEGMFRYAPLQGSTASDLVDKGVLPEGKQLMSSMVLLQGGTVYFKSTAALKGASRLGGFWSLARILLLVPRPVRDGVYDFIARRRIRYFGERNVCDLPAPSARERFLP